MDEQAILGNKGARPIIDWRDEETSKTYKFKLSYHTQRVKAKVVRAAKLDMLAQLKDLKDGMEPEEYERDWAKLKEDCRSGKFTFDSPEVVAFRQTEAGKTASLRAMLGDDADDLTESQLTRMVIERWDQIEAEVELSRVKLTELLKDAGFDFEAAEKRFREELGIVEGSEPSEEQAKQLAERLEAFARAVDPKVHARCLIAAGMLE